MIAFCFVLWSEWTTYTKPALFLFQQCNWDFRKSCSAGPHKFDIKLPKSTLIKYYLKNRCLWTDYDTLKCQIPLRLIAVIKWNDWNKRICRKLKQNWKKICRVNSPREQNELLNKIKQIKAVSTLFCMSSMINKDLCPNEHGTDISKTQFVHRPLGDSFLDMFLPQPMWMWCWEECSWHPTFYSY